MIQSLREHVTKQIENAVGKDTSRRDPRHVFIPIAILFGLFPLIAYFFIPFPPPKSVKDVTTWAESLWVGTGALFVLTLTISTIVTGLGFSRAGRASVFNDFRKRGFDAVVVLGLVYLASTASAITRLFMTGHDDVTKTPYVGRVLCSTLGGAILLMFAIGLLTYQSAEIFSSANEAKERERRVKSSTYLVMRDFAIEKYAERVIGAWADKHRVRVVSIFSIGMKGTRFLHNRESSILDIDMQALTKWVECLHTPVSEHITDVALLSLGLNAYVGIGQPMALVHPNHMNTQELFFNAISFKETSFRRGSDVLMEELTALRDDAVSNCETNRRSELTVVLRTFNVFYETILRHSEQLRLMHKIHLTLDPNFTAAWVIQLQEIGNAVVAANSQSLSNTWLFFIRRLLRSARMYSADYAIQPVIRLFGEFATATQKTDNIFWLHLKDYQHELDYDVELGPESPKMKGAIYQMNVQLVDLAKTLLMRLPVNEFDNIRLWVDQIGASLIRDALDHPETDWLIAFEKEILDAKKKMWMLYAAWLLKQMREDKISSEIVANRMEHVRTQFQSLDDVLQIFSGIDDYADLVWAEVPEGNSFRFGDPRAGTHEVAVVVCLSLLTRMPQQEMTLNQNMDWFEQLFISVCTRMEGESEVWAPIVGIPPTEIGEAVRTFKERFSNNHHRADFERYQRIVEAPLSTNKVNDFLRSKLEAFKSDDLQIFKRLQEGGKVVKVPKGKPKQYLLMRNEYLPKDSFIDGADWVSLSDVTPPASWTESRALLSCAENYKPIYVSTVDEAVNGVYNALFKLQERKTPATIILVPYEYWKVIRKLEEHDDFAPATEEAAMELGQLKGVPVFKVPFWDKPFILVASLHHWISLNFYEAMVNDDRFIVELRTLSDDEIDERIQNGESKKSRADRAFTSEELRTVFGADLLFKLWEPVEVRENDPEACIKITLQTNSI